jgi:DNA-binding NarL/FixJ family response regulator
LPRAGRSVGARDRRDDGEALRVLVIGDDPLARSGLLALFSADPGLRAAGQLAANAEALAELDRHSADVLLIDLGPETSSVLAGLEELRGLFGAGDAAGLGSPPALALVSSEEAALWAFTAGAQGLLFRDAEASEVQAALRSVARGLVVLDGALAPLLRARIGVAGAPPESAEPAGPPAGPDALTPRELEVLALLSEGHTNRAIAEQLGISEHTAKFHVNAILSKLGAETRTEAVVRAARLGLIVL